ncbi:DUF4190 domain-containing protein [Endomicrobium proavitum]|uniref:DUF4190 domain-containing protein n=1 Tax=Endomicrobium proavitum TaxID=1408281 RepID=A0A0G3WHT3_9BACT|nr:DUF4190 domain-containing protein [Endomicrobium proavitum]AKL98226.1 exported protein of unknown function [Endomicrobium proavitum]
MNIASFVLGLVSFLGGSLLCGVPPILGIIFGAIGLSRKEDNRNLGIAGIILSALSVIGWVLIYFFFIAAMVAAGAANSH